MNKFIKLFTSFVMVENSDQSTVLKLLNSSHDCSIRENNRKVGLIILLNWLNDLPSMFTWSSARPYSALFFM